MSSKNRKYGDNYRDDDYHYRDRNEKVKSNWSNEYDKERGNRRDREREYDRENYEYSNKKRKGFRDHSSNKNYDDWHNKNYDKKYSNYHDSQNYDKHCNNKNNNYYDSENKRRNNFDGYYQNNNERKYDKNYGTSMKDRGRKRSRNNNSGTENDSDYSLRSNSEARYTHSDKNRKYKQNNKEYDENKNYYINDYNNIKYVKNLDEHLEKRPTVELSRFIFIYKISNDITEEEIDEVIRNIAIHHAFSLPVNIHINKLSYFSTRDELFVRENLEFLKNNFYFNYIHQHNIINPQVENLINDDTCCIIEFPSNEASRKLFSLYEHTNYSIKIKNNLTSYIFPLFKLKKKNISEEKHTLKKASDWICSSCNFLNFSRRVTCHLCKAEKTADAKSVDSEKQTIASSFFLNHNTILNNQNSNINANYFSKFVTNTEKGPNEAPSNIHIKSAHTINETVGNNINVTDFAKHTDYSHLKNEGKESEHTEKYIQGYNNSLLYPHNNNNQFEFLNNNKNVEKGTQQILNDKEKTNMLILKDIDGNISNKDILTFLNEMFEKRNVKYLYLFNDIKGSNKRKGFCAIEFNNEFSAEKMMKELDGNYYVKFQNNYLKLDYIYEKEKSAFFECIQLAKLNIHKSSASQFNNSISYFNFFINYLEAILNSNIINYTYFLAWSSQIIILKNEKPQLTEFFFDYNSKYYYHPVYQIYFDNNTSFYMSLANGYYIWNDTLKCLVRFYMDNSQTNYETNNEHNWEAEHGAGQASTKENADTHQISKNDKEINNRGTSENNNINMKISSLVQKAKMIALESKKNMEKMNINEINNSFEKNKKQNDIIKKHFSTDSADDDNDSSDLEELKKKKGYYNNNTINSSKFDQKPKHENNYKETHGKLYNDKTVENINNYSNYNENISNLKDGNSISNTGVTNNFNDINNINQHQENIVDLNICFICLRKFENSALLQKHIDMSSLHKKNIQSLSDVTPVS
ncbi:Ran-binding protein, putative [Plasmodium vinckei lentum]|uniref:Ran-binding protein, putative n=1 Tax=Plasmodium vinckei lentum TaxID=138297 RepID=A0A6V7SB12_PLAVN|nr:Ran-binding protein, putative [Plasmodium vinckei lentum]